MARSPGKERLSGYEVVAGGKRRFRKDRGKSMKTFQKSNQRKVRQNKRRKNAGKAGKNSRGPKGSRGQVNRRQSISPPIRRASLPRV